MKRSLGLLGQGLVGVLGPGMRPQAPRNYRCRCGQPVFFRNSACLACGAALGFDPEALTLRSLLPAPQPSLWVDAANAGAHAPLLQRCANFGPGACNWLLPPGEAGAHEGLCRACRLNRTIPDLDAGDNALLWSRIEVAKRRLVSQLLALGLPVRSPRQRGPAAWRDVRLPARRAGQAARRHRPRRRADHAEHRGGRRRQARAHAQRAARALPHAAGPPAARDRPLLLGPPDRRQRLARALPRPFRRRDGRTTRRR